ncbi:hypothetical protein PHBOTO_004535, partial [Pseudozyma hubeiensis]
MSLVVCPVCHLSYSISNITAHIRRFHAGVRVSQEAAAASGLVACSCGQVVFNAAALKKHQGIRRCQQQSTLPTPPATLQPALMASPTIAFAEAPPTPPVTAQDTFPQAIVQEDEGIETFIPKDIAPPSPISQRTRSSTLLTDPEGATLPDLPELPPSPPQTQTHNGWNIAEEDMPEDGIVVLLGGGEQPQAPLPDMLMQTAADTAVQLPPIPPLAPIEDWDVAQTMDVDFFSVTISPATLLQLYPAGCFLALVARAPETRDLPLYKDWVFFAELKCRLAFAPQFKVPLVERLGQPPQQATLLVSPYPTTLTF